MATSFDSRNDWMPPILQLNPAYAQLGTQISTTSSWDSTSRNSTRRLTPRFILRASDSCASPSTSGPSLISNPSYRRQLFGTPHAFRGTRSLIPTEWMRFGRRLPHENASKNSDPLPCIIHPASIVWRVQRPSQCFARTAEHSFPWTSSLVHPLQR